MTPTTGSTHLWCPRQGRTLSGTEVLMGQGFVTTPFVGSTLDHLVLLGIDGLSHAALTRGAGNAMHVAAFGSILL